MIYFYPMLMYCIRAYIILGKYLKLFPISQVQFAFRQVNQLGLDRTLFLGPLHVVLGFCTQNRKRWEACNKNREEAIQKTFAALGANFSTLGSTF